MKKISLKPFFILILILCILMGQAGFVQADTTPVNDKSADTTAVSDKNTDTTVISDKDLEYLKSIMDIIKDKYKGELTNSQLIQGAVKGMFNSLDPYSTFFSKKEADNFMKTINGSYSGIGVTMELSGGYIMVSKVFAASPAEKAGIIQGDEIVEVNGKSIVGKSPEEAAALIMGDAGTKVKLGILRNGAKDLLRFEITRETIKINPVTYEIRNGIGYVKLEMFNSNTDDFLGKALNEMDKNKITKIVLDLRNNPGGEVGQAVAVAQRFVPRGLITRLDFNSGDYQDIEYTSNLDKPKYKLAILVNGMSASASEIVAGAIQDTRAGKLIGTKTFGKAKVQGMIPILTSEAAEKYKSQLGFKLSDVSVLESKYGIIPLDNEISGYTKITIGLYYTPGGRMIDGTGIIPDITVADVKPVSDVDINGIQKLTRTVKPGLNSQGTDVYNAEKILKILGYDVDSPDTKLDDKTFKAVKKFQYKSKIYNDGIMNFTTQAALNDALDKMVLKTDMQYAKAVEVLNKQ